MVGCQVLEGIERAGNQDEGGLLKIVELWADLADHKATHAASAVEFGYVVMPIVPRPGNGKEKETTPLLHRTAISGYFAYRTLGNTVHRAPYSPNQLLYCILYHRIVMALKIRL